MRKYACGVCGFVYDEAAGYPEGGIAPGTKWEDVPDDWVCPLCGASKDDFEEEVKNTANMAESPVQENVEEMRELSFAEMSALCSNLSKGCAKQYLQEESGLFDQLAQYYKSRIKPVEGDQNLEKLLVLIQADLSEGYSVANNAAANDGDRGALRALVWGEKVTKMLNSLLKRYEKEQGNSFENTNVYVCEICGFVYVGDEVPDICPVCKVPQEKITQVERN